MEISNETSDETIMEKGMDVLEAAAAYADVYWEPAACYASYFI